MIYSFTTWYDSEETGEIEVEVECWIDPPQRQTYWDPGFAAQVTVEHVRHNGKEIKVDRQTEERFERLAIERLETEG